MKAYARSIATTAFLFTFVVATHALTGSSSAQASGVLTGLSLSEGALSPVFEDGTLNYTATVPFTTTSLTVTATAPAGTPITLNGATISSGVASPAQSLSVGANNLTIGAFGDEATIYTVVVTREVAPSPVLLRPVFSDVDAL